MGKNPLILTLWFLMELVALYAQGYWGWTQHHGVLRIVLAIGVPLTAAMIWAIFRVPNDGGDPTVVVTGKIRLLIEITFWSLTVGLLFAAHQTTAAIIFGGVMLALYALTYDRVWWLISGAADRRLPRG